MYLYILFFGQMKRARENLLFYNWFNLSKFQNATSGSLAHHRHFYCVVLGHWKKQSLIYFSFGGGQIQVNLILKSKFPFPTKIPNLKHTKIMFVFFHDIFHHHHFLRDKTNVSLVSGDFSSDYWS